LLGLSDSKTPQDIKAELINRALNIIEKKMSQTENKISEEINIE
jgi:hypothetical protein